MKLTDTFIRSLKATGKIQKITDGNGLYLHVNKKGDKFWRIRYSFNGKRNAVSLGQYPYISLAEARKQLIEVKEQLAKGINPSAHKKAIKTAQDIKDTNSFEIKAREWHAVNKNKWTEGHAKRIMLNLEKDIFPFIGNMPIEDITTPLLLSAVRKIEARGSNETAHRILQNCRRIFSYAISTGCAERNIANDIKWALAPVKKSHHAAIIEPKAAGQLLRDIDEYTGDITTRLGLRIIPYVFVRQGELRMAKWDEFNFDTEEWHIPAERMKMRQPHIVPLSRQVIEMLRELRQYTGSRDYLFPSYCSKNRCMSNMALLSALRRMGYSKDEMTIHGFRSMASTMLNGKGYSSDWIERQLAHSESNSVRAAYNHSDYLQGRKLMMQDWADYLDELRESK